MNPGGSSTDALPTADDDMVPDNDDDDASTATSTLDVSASNDNEAVVVPAEPDPLELEASDDNQVSGSLLSPQPALSDCRHRHHKDGSTRPRDKRAAFSIREQHHTRSA